MKKFAPILAFSACLCAQTPTTTAPAPAPPAAVTDPNRIVLTVGDQKLTAGQYEMLIAALPAQTQAQARGDKRTFAENIIDLLVLANQATADNLDSNPAFIAQLTFTRDTMLANAEFSKLAATTPVPDALVQAYYDAHKSDYETVTARHILIRFKDSPVPLPAGKPELTEDQAKAKADALRQRLVAGEDFAAIAKAESDDTTSGVNGGEVGSFHRGQMVQVFEDAAFTLKPGEISQPVRSEFGYHIIQVEKRDVKTVDQVKTDILPQLRGEVAHNALAGLVAKSAVQMDDSYFGPAPAKPAVPAPAAK